MPDSCTVLIAAADALPALKARAAAGGGELLAFTDVDALRALEAITRRKPGLVALERRFAVSPRGAALINRIKADPSLARSEIRVISQDDEPAAPRADVIPPQAQARAESAEAPAESDVPLDAAGTRRAPRVPIGTSIEVLVDGNAATLVDLSMTGAQVVSPTILKPNQRVRVTLTDESGSWRLNGVIAWAAFEIPPQYRAGIEFADADSATLRALCAKHQA